MAEEEVTAPETAPSGASAASGPSQSLDVVYDVPVDISVVLGRTQMTIDDLLNVQPGMIVELERKVGEPVDLYVNDRLVARGEVVIVEDKIGITMTEIIKPEPGETS